MRTVRRQAHHQGIRVAYIAPTYVRTVIQSEAVFRAMKEKGIEMATTDSCLAAVMRISCDKTINGKARRIHKLRNLLNRDNRPIFRNRATLNS